MTMTFPLLTRTHVHSLDFGTDIIAGLAYHGCTSIPFNGLEKRVADAFPQFLQQMTEDELKVDFRIILHPIYQDSPVLRRALAHPVSCGLAVYNYDRIHLNLHKTDTETIFRTLPGDSTIWINLAKNILDGK